MDIYRGMGTVTHHVTGVLALQQVQRTAQEAEAAYDSLERLCQAIKAEIMKDLGIHDSAILPSFINLPQITADEYSRVGFLPPPLCAMWYRYSKALYMHGMCQRMILIDIRYLAASSSTSLV